MLIIVKMKILILAWLLMLISVNSIADQGIIISQPLALADSSNDDSGEDKYNTYSFSLSYSNNRTFRTKKDAGSNHNLTPDFTFTHKSNIYAGISSYYMIGDGTLFDEVDLTAGYDYEISEKMDAGISYSHYFFTANSIQLKSSVSDNADIYLSRKFGDFKTKLLFALDYGVALDYMATWYGSYSFDKEDLFKKEDELSITPGVSVSFGTQSYYQDFLKNKKDKVTNKKGVTLPDYKTVTTSFGFMDASADLSISYSYKKFTFDISAGFNISPESDTKKTKYSYYYSFGAGITYDIKTK
jgi:hypothetical protein